MPPRYSGIGDVVTRLPGGFSAMSAAYPLLGDRARTAGDAPASLAGNGSPIAVVAFPRTGSRFLATAVSELLHGVEVPHLHDPLLIEMLQRQGVQVLVSLRSPLDAAISWSIYNGDEPTEKLLLSRLKAYVMWHRYIRRLTKDDRLAFLRFENFTADPAAALASFLPNTESRSITSRDVWLQVAADNNASSWEVTNLPSEHRQQRRARYDQYVSTRSIHRTLSQADELYRELVSLRAPISVGPSHLVSR